MSAGLNFTPGGRSHRILAKLREANGHFGHLANAIGANVETSRNQRRKLWRLIDVLRDYQLIGDVPGNWFTLLPAGEAELEHLNELNGGPPRPRVQGGSVRLFTPNTMEPARG